jgi:lipopolysaccharide/colanic/teichoic acid biosynthesis glycosyltransferase
VIFSAAVLIPCFLLVATCLLVLNPILNPGPLFYRPQRMGRDCRPFRLCKFRTMAPAAAEARGPDDPGRNGARDAAGRVPAAGAVRRIAPDRSTSSAAR